MAADVRYRDKFQGRHFLLVRTAESQRSSIIRKLNASLRGPRCDANSQCNLTSRREIDSQATGRSMSPSYTLSKRHSPSRKFDVVVSFRGSFVLLSFFIFSPFSLLSVSRDTERRTVATALISAGFVVKIFTS